MAEIRIEEKKSGGGSIWPWIIGLLLLGLIVWGVAEAFDESEEAYTEEVLEDDDEVAPMATDNDEEEYDNRDYMNARQTYLSTTDDMEGDMGLGHEFSHRALTQLAMATVALAKSKGMTEDASARSKADRVKRLADEIMKDPMATDHADRIKTAAMLITEMLEDIDGDSYNRANAEGLENLREEAQDIAGKSLTLDQKMDVRSFFREARTVLENMS